MLLIGYLEQNLPWKGLILPWKNKKKKTFFKLFCVFCFYIRTTTSVYFDMFVSELTQTTTMHLDFPFFLEIHAAVRVLCHKPNQLLLRPGECDGNVYP